MPIITQAATIEQSFVVKLVTSTGRNHIQKQSGTYSAMYMTPDSRTEEKTIELPPSQTYESNMSETYNNLVIFTNSQLGLSVTHADGISANVVVNKLFACDSPILHFSIINNGNTNASIKLNTVSVSMNQPLGLIYQDVALHPSTYDEQFVKSLQSYGGAKDRTFQVNAGSSEKIFYCYPQAYGGSQFEVNGFVGGFYLAAQTSVQTPNGAVVYNIYESDNTGLGLTTVTVSS